MCTVSNTLKLCSCNVPSSETNFWVLSRWMKGKAEYIIGETMPPFDIDPETDSLNAELLLRQLNEASVFDEGILPKERDRLALFFYFSSKYPEHLIYGFRYSRKKWILKEYDPFEWSWKHEEVKTGLIISKS